MRGRKRRGYFNIIICKNVDGGTHVNLRINWRAGSFIICVIIVFIVIVVINVGICIDVDIHIDGRVRRGIRSINKVDIIVIITTLIQFKGPFVNGIVGKAMRERRERMNALRAIIRSRTFRTISRTALRTARRGNASFGVMHPK